MLDYPPRSGGCSTPPTCLFKLLYLGVINVLAKRTGNIRKDRPGPSTPEWKEALNQFEVFFSYAPTPPPNIEKTMATRHTYTKALTRPV